MKSAKELFQASPAFIAYKEILNNAGFEPACHAALSDFVESLPANAGDPSKAWDCYLQIVGARAVLERLSRLHELPEKNRPDPWPTLHYDRPKPQPKK